MSAWATAVRARCSWRRGLAAVALALGLCAASPPLGSNGSGDRAISFYNIHTKETTTVTYKRGGRLIPEAMKQIDWALRDWRRDEATRMDPELIDLVWEVHAELGSKEPIHVISAFRSRNTNDMLRRTSGGQASESRHILGKAIDVHFPDVPVRMLRYSALIRERGGVGYYPTSAIPFVHIDTDRVRAWPRLPRPELALLFPHGRTKHVPDDGGSIGPEDAKLARTRNAQLATQVASFHDLRRQPPRQAQGFALAALTPPMPVPAVRPARSPSPSETAAASPRLLEPPRLVDRPSRFTPPSDSDRRRLDALARAAVGASTEPQNDSLNGIQASFIPAPGFDEEHPEEMSYRPFPIAPLLTATSSVDDPALIDTKHPDVARTLDMLDQSGSAPPMRLRPLAQAAAMMWSRQFTGEAVNLSALADPARANDGGTLASRRVSTAAR